MTDTLSGKEVAILVANGFEQVELTSPKEALEKAGAKVTIVSPEQHTVKGWDYTNWGDDFKVDLPLDRAKAEDFDALRAARRRDESRYAEAKRVGFAICAGIRRVGQTDRGDLPRTVDPDRCRRGVGP